MNKEKWWQQAAFYQIYMPSFCDGNGDGIGDFIGITSKLPYLKELGIDCIWLTPFYTSPKVDNGYDIADYYAIDKDYGTMEDFEAFIEKAHSLGIRVIADIVLNHTSNQHIWFKESRSSLDNPKRDWYIWKKPVNDGMPNNWESFFGEKAWEYDEHTKEYYYHAFAKEQVDLNWANIDMKKAVFDILAFWMDKGIDGFRLDVINFLTVNDTLTDNPYDEDGEQIHQYDTDQEGIMNIMKELRTFTEQYKDKFLVGEIGSEELAKIYSYVGDDKLHTTFNFNLGSKKSFEIQDFYNEIEKMHRLYKKDLPTLFFGSHDMSRFPSRFNLTDEEVKLIATFMMTFRGIPFIYFGDEVGMRDLTYKNINMAKDIQGIIAYHKAIEAGKTESEAMEALNKAGRDKSRSVMQWNDRKYGGFSDVEPWIAMGDNYKTHNVAKESVDRKSILKYYQKMLKLRKVYKALSLGECIELGMKDNVIYYIKKYESQEMMIILNFSTKDISIDTFNVEVKTCISSSQLVNHGDRVKYIASKSAAIYIL